MYIAEGIYALSNGMSVTQRYSALINDKPAPNANKTIDDLLTKFEADGGVVL